MKTQIIHLEPHDDVASVLDKLKWAKAERLVLVWPGRNRILTEQLDLRLIQRQAARCGAQVGIVSLDPDVQAHAASLGIPVFERLSTLHTANWPDVRKSPGPAFRPAGRSDRAELREKKPGVSPRPIRMPFRIALFALPLVLIVLAFILLLPSATVYVRPVRTVQQQVLSLTVHNPADREDGGVLYEDRVRVEGSIRVATTGISSEPGDPARGIAEFTNLGDESVAIPAGTTIRVPNSDQLYFITQSRVIVPAGSGSTRSVEIVASLPGAGGNLPAGRITAVDGPLGLSVSVQNPEATSGGSVISRSAVSPSDLNSARSQLTGRLLDQAEEILEANRLASERMVPESLSIEEVLFEQYDREAGDTADTLGLELGAIAKLSYINLEELSVKLEQRISAELDPDEQVVPESLTIGAIQLDRPQASEGSSLEVEVKYELYQRLDKEQVADKIRGLNPLSAQRLLADLHPQNNFVLELKPAWYPLLPLFEVQISVRYPWEASP